MQGGVYGAEQACAQIASSPRLFCGSPPSRVSNPLTKDDRFGDEKVLPFSPLSPIAGPTSGFSSPPSSSSRKGGCIRANFGSKPAERIEGFDCLNRDRQNHGIPALAWQDLDPGQTTSYSIVIYHHPSLNIDCLRRVLRSRACKTTANSTVLFSCVHMLLKGCNFVNAMKVPFTVSISESLSK